MPNPRYLNWRHGDKSLFKVKLQRNGVIAVDPDPGCSFK